MHLFEIDFQDLFPGQSKGLRFGIICADADEAIELGRWWYGLEIKSASRARTLTRSLPHEVMCEYQISYVIDARHDIRVVGGFTGIGVIIQQLCNIGAVVLGMQRISTFRNLQRPVQSEPRGVIVTE